MIDGLADGQRCRYICISVGLDAALPHSKKRKNKVRGGEGERRERLKDLKTKSKT